MFNLIDIGERAGSGIPSIYYIWNRQGWSEPSFTQTFEPNRITLSLPTKKSGDKKVTIKNGDKKTAIKSSVQKQAIIEYLTENVYAKSARIKVILSELTAEGIITSEGGNRNRKYKLKS